VAYRDGADPAGVLISINSPRRSGRPSWRSASLAKAEPARLAAIVLGLIGVVVIVRPGIGSVDPGRSWCWAPRSVRLLVW
jgi:hypothetical protein